MKNILLLVVLIGLVVPYASAQQEESYQAQVCNSTSLNLREGPGIEYPVITRLENFTPVTVFSQTETSRFFVQVEVNGQRGWVYRPYLGRLPRIARVSTDHLNVRMSPMTSAPAITQFRLDEQVEVLAREGLLGNGVWYFVRSLESGIEGWVSRLYLSGEYSISCNLPITFDATPETPMEGFIWTGIGLNLYAEAGVLERIGYVQSGTRFSAIDDFEIEHNYYWFNVILEDGRTGWVFQARRNPGAVVYFPVQVQIVPSSLDIYDAPDGQVVNTVEASNQCVLVTNATRQGDQAWAYLAGDTATGWVVLDLLLPCS